MSSFVLMFHVIVVYLKTAMQQQYKLNRIQFIIVCEADLYTLMLYVS